MIDYQNEIEAQTTYLEGAVEMQKMLNNFTNNQGLRQSAKPRVLRG